MKLVQIIPTLHTLEQISSDERVGSLAENLLEAMKENVMVAEKVGALFRGGIVWVMVFLRGGWISGWS